MTRRELAVIDRCGRIANALLRTWRKAAEFDAKTKGEWTASDISDLEAAESAKLERDQATARKPAEGATDLMNRIKVSRARDRAT